MSLRLVNAPAAATRRPAVACRASAANAPLARRAALGGLLAAGAALLPAPRRALALIPDEEDEELLEKAKANRAARLAKNQEATREFIRDEGFSNKRLEGELVPVQKAITLLAQSGSQLEAGDAKGAASTLGGGWVDDLKRATTAISTEDTQALFDGINGLKAAARKGDLKASKQQYVAVVGSFSSWAEAAGVAKDLKGL